MNVTLANPIGSVRRLFEGVLRVRRVLEQTAVRSSINFPTFHLLPLDPTFPSICVSNDRGHSSMLGITMAPDRHDRDYDIVLLGATGYTGALTAESIAQQLPTNLRWAIAGRSQKKLEELAAKLKSSHSDRVQPRMSPGSLSRTTRVEC